MATAIQKVQAQASAYSKKYQATDAALQELIALINESDNTALIESAKEIQQELIYTINPHLRPSA